MAARGAGARPFSLWRGRAHLSAGAVAAGRAGTDLRSTWPERWRIRRSPRFAPGRSTLPIEPDGAKHGADRHKRWDDEASERARSPWSDPPQAQSERRTLDGGDADARGKASGRRHPPRARGQRTTPTRRAERQRAVRPRRPARDVGDRTRRRRGRRHASGSALIVPAVISLMGRWSWWPPTWPARLLRVEPSLPRRGLLRRRLAL